MGRIGRVYRREETALKNTASAYRQLPGSSLLCGANDAAPAAMRRKVAGGIIVFACALGLIGWFLTLLP